MELRLVLPGFACASLMALNAAAQVPPAAPAPGPQPAPAAAPAPAVAHTIVLLTEMTGDPAVDAQLRAATDGILQRIRARGYEMHPPAAVGAAMPANPHPANLRAAVGAELLVRAAIRSREQNRAVVNVTVLSALGQRTQDLTCTTPEISTVVPALADSLIPPPGTAVAPTPAPVPAAPLPQAAAASDRVLLRDGTMVEGKILHGVPGQYVVIATNDGRQRTITWDRIAEVQSAGSPSAPTAHAPAVEPELSQGTWDRRGGSIFTFDVQAMLVGMLESVTTNVDKTFTSGETMRWTGTGNAGGGGGGLGFHMGYLFLGAPDASKGGTWAGFRAVTGIEFAYVAYGHRTDAVIQAGLRGANGEAVIPGTATGGETKWTGSYVKMIPLSLGGQFGFGKFWGETQGRWSGTMLGIDWRPTYYHSKPGDRDATSGINPAGMQLTLDVGSLEPKSKPEANFRMSLVWLPPVGDHPTLLSLGFGAAWY